jgi:pimeloyl-ACP methyl ester carboxylesterase
MLGQLNSKASILSLGLLMVVAMFSFSILSNYTFNNYSTSALAQPFIETVKYRDLVIDLGNGIQTNAQLTIPAVGNGPFPGVLLVAGSGAIDMNETLSPDSKPFWQISQYLSERGFVVLRYDKRGIGANGTILDTNVWGNATFDDLKNDAARALSMLIEQPEVDPNKITLIGHSEGTVIIPRLVIDLNNDNNNSTGNLTKIANIVLMGVGAQNLIDIMHFQVVDNPLLYAHQVLDKNHSGLFSVQQPIEIPPLSQTVATHFGNSTTDYVDIESQLKPLLERVFENITSGDTEARCPATGICPIWVRSHGELESTLEIIGNVSQSTSILIMNGENDSQSSVQQAFLLEQKLNEANHPDHTLVTYPDLGHVFSPSMQWFTEFGPM